MSVEISNIYNVNVAPNEIMMNHVINRNLIKLIDNDINLHNYYTMVLNSLNISDYDSKNLPYRIGSLVWYRKGGDLFLLKCIKQENEEPYTNSNDEFVDSGWKNMNDNLNILSYGVVTALSGRVDIKFSEHQESKQYHKFGKIQNLNKDEPNHISTKILTKDLADLNENREKVFFPNEVKRLPQDSTCIMNGYYRKYDNGILEYDIIFKLGEDEVDESDIRNVFGEASTISANNVTFKAYNGINKRSSDTQENAKYFYNVSNMDMFSMQNGEVSKIGYSSQGNRNDFVNTYFGKINFPVKFVDLNYMIYSNNMVCQGYSDDHDLQPNSNELIFCDKTRESVVAMNVMFENDKKLGDSGYNAKHGGLALNTFHCKIIGRYK